jgi:hypothetical protein
MYYYKSGFIPLLRAACPYVQKFRSFEILKLRSVLLTDSYFNSFPLKFQRSLCYYIITQEQRKVCVTSCIRKFVSNVALSQHLLGARNKSLTIRRVIPSAPAIPSTVSPACTQCPASGILTNWPAFNTRTVWNNLLPLLDVEGSRGERTVA